MTCFQLPAEAIIRRLRWVMLLVILIDAACTLYGQPPAYWSDHDKVNEIEPITRFFLVRGILSYSVGAIVYVVGAFLLVSLTPARIALTILFAFLLAHFWGATSWLLYHFHYGVRSQNAFEITVAALMTLAFGRTNKPSSPVPEITGRASS